MEGPTQEGDDPYLDMPATWTDVGRYHTSDMNETNVPRFDAALVNYEPQCEEATTSASDKGPGYLKVSRYVLADRMSRSRNQQAVPIPAEVLFQILFRFAFPNDSDYYLTRYESFYLFGVLSKHIA